MSTATFCSKLWHSSMQAIKMQSRLVLTFNFLNSTQKRSDLFFLVANIVGAAHSVKSGSTLFTKACYLALSIQILRSLVLSGKVQSVLPKYSHSLAKFHALQCWPVQSDRSDKMKTTKHSLKLPAVSRVVLKQLRLTFSKEFESLVLAFGLLFLPFFCSVAFDCFCLPTDCGVLRLFYFAWIPKFSLHCNNVHHRGVLRVTIVYLNIYIGFLETFISIM